MCVKKCFDDPKNMLTFLFLWTHWLFLDGMNYYRVDISILVSDFLFLSKENHVGRIFSIRLSFKCYIFYNSFLELCLVTHLWLCFKIITMLTLNLGYLLTIPFSRYVLKIFIKQYIFSAEIIIFILSRFVFLI